MRDEIKTTWIIAGLLVAVMGLSSLLADSSNVLAQNELDITSVATGTVVAKKITEKDDTCGWVGSLFSKS
ncbi:hypothetical protein NBZ79_14385 [Sneathiella marina]|uniref:Uncharacterized protein n=1 Tax=Sneathiella marina TaxID=2950108 RepID=A0ABY4W6T3_9PROT|nr:hypothetical protein [Sneathiella marina]USG60356.1 hypothetical protein NBZ79_14385 [Sneathiella marina]